MIALFKLGIEVVLFLGTLGLGFIGGAKAQQKYPTKVAALLALIKL